MGDSASPVFHPARIFLSTRAPPPMTGPFAPSQSAPPRESRSPRHPKIIQSPRFVVLSWGRRGAEKRDVPVDFLQDLLDLSISEALFSNFPTLQLMNHRFHKKKRKKKRKRKMNKGGRSVRGLMGGERAHWTQPQFDACLTSRFISPTSALAWMSCVRAAWVVWFAASRSLASCPRTMPHLPALTGFPSSDGKSDGTSRPSYGHVLTVSRLYLRSYMEQEARFNYQPAACA